MGRLSLFFFRAGHESTAEDTQDHSQAVEPFLRQYLGTPSRYRWKGSHQMRITRHSFGALPSFLILLYL